MIDGWIQLLNYQRILGELKADILLFGDFNPDPHKGRFWQYLSEFTAENDFIIADSRRPFDSFTYFSPSHNTCSWLDHAVCSTSLNVQKIEILYHLSSFDPFPVSLVLKVSTTVGPKCSINQNLLKEFINWKLFDKNVISVYQKKVEELLDGLTIYDNIGCTNDHTDQIDEAYYRIVYALKEGAAPYAFNKRKEITPVAGWNEHCKELHTRARNAFLEWVQDGKIRNGDLFQKMKDKRHDFVSALTYCKNNKK